MRIKEEEIGVFTKVLDAYLLNASAKLYLFGSRVHDHQKGGDIDLLLMLQDSNQENEMKSKKSEILEKFKRELGERKIDLLISTPQKITSDLFLKSIYPSAILLHEWLK